MYKLIQIRKGKRDAPYSGAAQGKEVSYVLVPGKKYSVGRREGCDIYLWDDKSVSRKHAELVLVSGISHGEKKTWISVTDLGSGSGTFINSSKPLPKNIPWKMAIGDAVRFGSDSNFTFCENEAAWPKLTQKRPAVSAAYCEGSDSSSKNMKLNDLVTNYDEDKNDNGAASTHTCESSRKTQSSQASTFCVTDTQSSIPSSAAALERQLGRSTEQSQTQQDKQSSSFVEIPPTPTQSVVSTQSEVCPASPYLFSEAPTLIRMSSMEIQEAERKRKLVDNAEKSTKKQRTAEDTSTLEQKKLPLKVDDETKLAYTLPPIGFSFVSLILPSRDTEEAVVPAPMNEASSGLPNFKRFKKGPSGILAAPPFVGVTFTEHVIDISGKARPERGEVRATLKKNTTDATPPQEEEEEEEVGSTNATDIVAAESDEDDPAQGEPLDEYQPQKRNDEFDFI